MFRLIRLECRVGVPPSLLHHTLSDALLHAAKQRFCGRVLPPYGLAVTVQSAVPRARPRSLPFHPVDGHTGQCWVTVQADVVVWAPQSHEVLLAQVRSCSPQGVRASALNGFDVVLVPPGSLMEPCTWDEERRCWSWRYAEEEFVVHEADWVRVRVERVEFREGGGDEGAVGYSKEAARAVRRWRQQQQQQRRGRVGRDVHQSGGEVKGDEAATAIPASVSLWPPPAPLPSLHADEAEADKAMPEAHASSYHCLPDERELWESDLLPMRVWARMDRPGLGCVEWWASPAEHPRWRETARGEGEEVSVGNGS